MNTMLSFTDDELDDAIAGWVKRLPKLDEPEQRFAMERMAQLERAKQSGHALHNFAMQEAA